MVKNYQSAILLALVYASRGSAGTASYNGAVTPFQIESPDTGSCRLKGIDKSSDNFKYFASVSATVSNMNEGCGRCIKVTKEGAPSIVAFVLDVCTGCKNQDVKLSTETLSKLSIDPNSHTTSVDYKFVACPRQFVSGNVKACLMEGASDSYVPLQFYNSQKVLKDVQINGVAGTQQKDSFFYSVNPKSPAGGDWYKKIDVSLTSKDGETQTGSFAFDGKSGCATSSFQFSAASTADGTGDDADGASGSGSVNMKLILPLILGCVAAVIVLIGSVFLYRRRHQSPDNDNYDEENQYMSPVPTKEQHNPSPRNDQMGPGEEGAFSNSPGYEFGESVTPPASVSRAPVPQPQYQQTLPPHVYNARAPPASTDSQKRKYSYTYTAPSYQYSKPETPERPAADRTSFDIDDLRQTEEFKVQNQQPLNQQPVYPSGVVTSPQSYVRSTTLRRKGSIEHNRSSDLMGYPRSQGSNITGK